MDPAQPHSSLLKISSIWGQGEHLVSGEASPDEFFVDKGNLNIVERVISNKPVSQAAAHLVNRFGIVGRTHQIIQVGRAALARRFEYAKGPIKVLRDCGGGLRIGFFLSVLNHL